MRSDISYKEKYREEYRVDNPQEMQEGQKIIFSNGFLSFGHGKNYGKILPGEVWPERMWLEGMSLCLITTESNHRNWGWNRWNHNSKTFKQLKEKWRYKMNKMNKIIIEMFPVTKEAVLVDKWFGTEIDDDPLTRLLIKGKESDLIAEAEKLEADEKAKK